MYVMVGVRALCGVRLVFVDMWIGHLGHLWWIPRCRNRREAGKVIDMKRRSAISPFQALLCGGGVYKNGGLSTAVCYIYSADDDVYTESKHKMNVARDSFGLSEYKGSTVSLLHNAMYSHSCAHVRIQRECCTMYN